MVFRATLLYIYILIWVVHWFVIFGGENPINSSLRLFSVEEKMNTSLRRFYHVYYPTCKAYKSLYSTEMTPTGCVLFLFYLLFTFSSAVIWDMRQPSVLLVVRNAIDQFQVVSGFSTRPSLNCMKLCRIVFHGQVSTSLLKLGYFY